MIDIQPITVSKAPVNRRIVIAITAATLLTAPTAALAASTAARTGSFDAMGTGTLVAEGKLRVFGTIEGTIVIRDRIGGAVVKIAGVRQRPKRTVVRGQTQFVYKLQDIDGAFFAKGQSIRIELRAPDEQTLSMSAFGRGQVTRLSGEGTYHLNGDDEHEWTSAVPPIEIAPPQSFPKPTPPGGGDRPR